MIGSISDHVSGFIQRGDRVHFGSLCSINRVRGIMKEREQSIIGTEDKVALYEL